MFKFFKEKRIKRIVKYTDAAFEYILQKYIDPTPVAEEKPSDKPIEKLEDSGVRYSISGTRLSEVENDVLYSERDTVENHKTSADFNKSVSGSRLETASQEDIRYILREIETADKYNAASIAHVLREYSTSADIDEMIQRLEQNVDQTFVDRLLYYINRKGVRDSKVYKAAQVDKRLFSKMVSNRYYKPSKDTAIALAMALELSLDETNDMLSRAGYTFSHSSKRDIIIEFFFREKIYNLIDANEVLDRFHQKLIGRF